jgi:hypothetical protein
MTAYADYTYYTDEYLGILIAEADFPRLSLRASEVVDQITFNGVAAIITADTPADQVLLIKNAVCAVAEEMSDIETGGGDAGIQSESLGNHSVTYVQGSTRTQTPDQRYVYAARKYLGDTGLMYRGF